MEKSEEKEFLQFVRDSQECVNFPPLLCVPILIVLQRVASEIKRMQEINENKGNTSSIPTKRTPTCSTSLAVALRSSGCRRERPRRRRSRSNTLERPRSSRQHRKRRPVRIRSTNLQEVRTAAQQKASGRRGASATRRRFLLLAPLCTMMGNPRVSVGRRHEAVGRKCATPRTAADESRGGTRSSASWATNERRANDCVGCIVSGEARTLGYYSYN